MTPRRHLPITLVGLLLLVAGPATADEPAAATAADIAAARQLFDEGNRLADGRDFGAALDRYERALARYPSAAIQLNIAGALRELKRSAEAANAYQRYVDHPDAKPSRIAEVRPILAALDATLGSLVIQVDGAEATVQVNDGPWRPAEEMRRVRVAPGPFVVRARSQGASREQTGQVAAGEVREVPIGRVEPPPAPAKTPDRPDHETTPTPPPQAPRPPETAAWPRRRVIGLSVGGAGVGAIGTGLVMGALAYSKWNAAKEICGGDLQCDTDVQRNDAENEGSSARVRGNVATALVGVGAVCAAAGAYLYFTAARPERRERPGTASVRLVPAISPDGVWVGAAGQF